MSGHVITLSAVSFHNILHASITDPGGDTD